MVREVAPAGLQWHACVNESAWKVSTGTDHRGSTSSQIVDGALCRQHLTLQMIAHQLQAIWLRMPALIAAAQREI